MCFRSEARQLSDLPCVYIRNGYGCEDFRELFPEDLLSFFMLLSFFFFLFELIQMIVFFMYVYYYYFHRFSPYGFHDYCYKPILTSEWQMFFSPGVCVCVRILNNQWNFSWWLMLDDSICRICFFTNFQQLLHGSNLEEQCSQRRA